MIDETYIEAEAIHQELETRLISNPDIQDLLLITQFTEAEKLRMLAMLRAAIVDGFRLGLEYQWELRKEITG